MERNLVSPTIVGFSIDAARLVESPEYYRKQFEFAASWGYNTILFRLMDDQGSAMRLDRHPDLLFQPGALSSDQMRDLVAYARQLGLQLIPEIESFGHAGSILRSPKYRHLADLGPTGGSTTALLPQHPEVIQLLSEIYEEVDEVFHSAYFHIGCDEVEWGGSEYSKHLIAEQGKAGVWTAHVNALAGILRSSGKDVLIWGDQPLKRDTSLLETLNTATILVDWDYSTTSAARVSQALANATAKGFRVLGAPALNWCRWGPRPGEMQLRNIDAYSDSYQASTSDLTLGLLVTNWVPGRYLPLSIWDGLAYAAVAFQEGSAVAQDQAWSRFVTRHYGATWNNTWQRVFQSSYSSAPFRTGCSDSRWQPILPSAWSSDSEVQELLQKGAPSSPESGTSEVDLQLAELQVQSHLDDFRSFALSAAYLRHLYWRDYALLAAIAPAQTESADLSLLGTIAERDNEILSSIVAEWNTNRPADPALIPGSSVNTAENLLWRFRRASDFSRKLAASPPSLPPNSPN
jgi:hypothetical protein